jgi:hypothetical protein
MNRVVSPNTLTGLSAKDADRALQSMTRAVYSTPEGALVLTALLQDLYFNRQAETPEQAALKNFATHYLVNRLGVKLGHNATVALLNQSEV